jgi:hypothetical protein
MEEREKTKVDLSPSQGAINKYCDGVELNLDACKMHP